MNYKTCIVVRNIHNILAMICALAVQILPRTFFPEGIGIWSTLLLIAALVLVLAGAVISSVFYRCPYCKELLSVREKHPTVCPHCKEKLEK